MVHHLTHQVVVQATPKCMGHNRIRFILHHHLATGLGALQEVPEAIQVRTEHTKAAFSHLLIMVAVMVATDISLI